MTGVREEVARRLGAPLVTDADERIARLDVECSELEARARLTSSESLRNAYLARLDALGSLRSALKGECRGERSDGHATDRVSSLGAIEGALDTSPSEGDAQGALEPCSQVEPEVYLWQSLCDGRFVVERVLWRGDIGVVYAASDTVKREEVALLVQAPWFPLGPSARKCLFRVAQGAAQIRHENIAAVHDLYTDGALVILAMEMVEGETLGGRLARLRRVRTRMPVDEVFEIARQCAGALAQAHRMGWVHGQVEPGNLLLLPSGRLKLRNLGSAWAVGQTSSSLENSAVEESQVAEFGWHTDEATGDFAADHEGLGKTLYEALAGQPLDGSALSLRELRPDVPRSLHAIIDGLLAPAAEVTSSSMDEVVQVLKPRRRLRSGIGTNVSAAVCGIAIVALWGMAVVQGSQWMEYDTSVVGHERYTGELILVPAGSFLMGSPSTEMGRDDTNEAPVPVSLTSSFYMGKYPVTQEQFEAVMGRTPSFFSACGSRCPVETVSWGDAVAFLDRLNDLHGYPRCDMAPIRTTDNRYVYACEGFRLPTESEWEYAARAGSTAARYGPIDAIAWYDENSGGRPRPVGEKEANAWGLHDMLGNVWEWTATRYDETLAGGEDPMESRRARASKRVRRGGAWDVGEASVRAATRVEGEYIGTLPGTTGFRIVRSAP